VKHITTFAVSHVQRLIGRARRAAAFPDGGPSGWSRSAVEPCALLSAFRTLWLRPGCTLRAYSFNEGGNGNAFVYAMPIDSPFPEPDKCARDDSHFLSPPVPPGALANLMEAIDGDGSALSYLSASILSRELREFGASWHGCNWSTHRILGEHPFTAPRSAGMMPEAAQWKWIEPTPPTWLPTVVTVHPITVRFYSHSALETERIVRHVDLFDRGKYCFDTEEVEIATGPGGFLF
jgi:hypothetical protein